MSFFAFDFSRRALVYADPETMKPRHITIQELSTRPCEALGGLGWNVDEAELRRALPRWDKPIVEIAGALPPGGKRR
jgi:hypothetical protein